MIIAAAYFVFMFISYSNKTSIKFYEVEEGSLVKEHNYSGIIIRNEKLVQGDKSGYVLFYVADSKKIPMGNRLYSIDASGNLNSYLEAHSDELTTYSKQKLRNVRNTIMSDSRSFSPMEFRETYLLKDALDAAVLEFTDMDAVASIADELKKNGINFSEHKTDTTGIVTYSIDGYEGIEISDINKHTFEKSYEKKRVRSGDLVEEGEPLCKIITDEDWKIVFPINSEDIEEFSGKDTLKISFKDKGITVNAGYSMFKGSDGAGYGMLELKRYLIQFVGERFINFEIVTNDVSGLKIPDKSLTQKNFHIIPSEYKTSDEKGNYGFLKQNITENGTVEEFVICEIYLDDGEYCYVDLNDKTTIKSGDFVGNSISGNYRTGAVKPLMGVYNINKGYAVFKRIELLEKANGYCIVKKNTPYGISVYDHIVLDAETVEEGQVLY